MILNLKNGFQQLVQFIASIASDTALLESQAFASYPAVFRVRQHEGVDGLCDLVEVRSNCEHLVDDVFNADDSALAESFLDFCVAGNWSLLAVVLDESVFEDQI